MHQFSAFTFQSNVSQRKYNSSALALLFLQQSSLSTLICISHSLPKLLLPNTPIQGRLQTFFISKPFAANLNASITSLKPSSISTNSILKPTNTKNSSPPPCIPWHFNLSQIFCSRRLLRNTINTLLSHTSTSAVPVVSPVVSLSKLFIFHPSVYLFI